MLSQIKSPMARVRNKYLGRVVAMLRVYATRWLPGTADIIAVGFSNMHMLIGVF